MKWEPSDSFLGLLTEQQVCSKINVMEMLYGGCKSRKKNEKQRQQKSTLSPKSTKIADTQRHFSENTVSEKKLKSVCFYIAASSVPADISDWSPSKRGILNML